MYEKYAGGWVFLSKKETQIEKMAHHFARPETTGIFFCARFASWSNAEHVFGRVFVCFVVALPPTRMVIITTISLHLPQTDRDHHHQVDIQSTVD